MGTSYSKPSLSEVLGKRALQKRADEEAAEAFQNLAIKEALAKSSPMSRKNVLLKKVEAILEEYFSAIIHNMLRPDRDKSLTRDKLALKKEIENEREKNPISAERLALLYERSNRLYDLKARKLEVANFTHNKEGVIRVAKGVKKEKGSDQKVHKVKIRF